MIEEKRYNEAVLLLSQVVKEDPDRFDAAEELMDLIRIRRTEIDEGYADLNTAIRENDLEGIVVLMDKLEELNPYPSDSESELLDMLRAAGVEQIYFVNLFRDIMASVRDVVGGRSKAYEEKMNEARDIAIKEMMEKAQALGADAVVGVDIDYETVGSSMMMVSASGTAVKTG